MTIEELKGKVEEYRQHLKQTTGRPIKCNSSGPVDMSVIDDIIALLEYQQKRIDSLEAKLEGQ